MIALLAAASALRFALGARVVDRERLSFVTLTTLGYGDIVLRHDVMRGLAIMEAVAGQLYLAVMVARLVSLYGLEAGKGNQRETQDGPDGSVP